MLSRPLRDVRRSSPQNCAMQSAGRKTALFDLDPQESSSIWSERRMGDLPHVEFLTERRLPEAFNVARAQEFALTLLDTPPGAGPHAFTAAEMADLILIPCRPSLVDLDAIKRTAAIVRTAGIPAFVIFNAAPIAATTLIDDAKLIVEGAGLVVAPVIIRERGAFRSAWPKGQGVVETEPLGKAAKEVGDLMNWVFDQLQGVQT
jgi:chromosome partitioning protein